MEDWLAEHALVVVIAVNTVALAATILAITNIIAFFKKKEAEEMGEGEDDPEDAGA